jgi:phosphoribosylformylglycinamidine synthase
VLANVIGTVTEGGSLRLIDCDGPATATDDLVVGELPAASLHEAAPLYHRPLAPPADLEARRADSANALDAGDPGADLLGMLCDTTWVSSQYDHQLFLNTVEAPGGDAAVLRLKHPTTGIDTGRGLAFTSDGNHRWCAIDPRVGALATVVESVMNLATVGARPLALVNCLNFGNPEHPEVMWQLSEAIDGMSEACRFFDLPVIGGNVSLYNESRGSDIDPTPVVATLGIIDRLDRRPPGVGVVDGGRLLLLGETVPELSGSLWARERGHRSGSLPAPDLVAAGKVAGLVRELVVDGVVVGAHDVSAGGIGLALAEMAVRSGVGVRCARVADHVELFAESVGRAVVCVEADRAREVIDACEAQGVPVTQLGAAMGDRIVVKDLVDLSLAEATQRWRDRLPVALGAGTAQG